ncbi:hypothetical protein [Calycomorphotria hydatis]|uniref:Uncharacterized protein n=1 Tax=Calycomorphotria hydatis TaxID=2528027 RepID=A0A517TAU4_9PLAN|nr:hypothetical protein [Calycomorphotria hydatis]QDT65492.1 hypothetical protein V22_27460 [Calycomorphotria hydatis]
MARKKKSAGASVSLFPFLSILACVIGVLTLMITSLALSQIDEAQDPEAVERASKMQELREAQDVSAEKLAEIQQLLSAAQALEDKLKAAMAELKELQDKNEASSQAEDAATKMADLLAELNRLRFRIPELATDIPPLDQELKELQERLKKLKAPPKEADVVIKPGGSGFNLDPTFVEVTTTGLVIHEDNGKQTRIRSGDIRKTSGDFVKLLTRKAGDARGIVVFLIREDAVDLYNSTENFARNYYTPNGYCNTGKLPVQGQGRIDLSRFKQ